MARRHRAVALILVLGLVAVGCGDSDDDDAAATTTAEATTTTVVPTTTSAPPTTAAPTATTEPPPSSTAELPSTSTGPTSTTGLPGEPIELFARPGQVWAVVGVAFDDVLNVRERPGTDQGIIATLAPTAHDVVTTGAARSLPRSIWYAIEADGGTGWVNSSFLALPGVVDDITSQVVADLGGIPSAETLSDLGELVAATRASDDVEPRIVVSVAPSIGDLGEITVDVLGLADDAAVGERLHVFAEEDPSGESFGLKSVEATTLCGRGVTDDGLCV